MNVLFLCQGNSARSQMAEALGNHFTNGRLCFFSAGTFPSKTVHPLAVRVMGEIGIDMAGHEPKSFTSVPKPLHWIVAVCGQAEAECPNVPGANVVRWDIPDPVHEYASEEEALNDFRRVRDDLHGKVRELLLREESDVA